MTAQLLYPGPDGVMQPHPLGLVAQTNDEYHSGPGVSKSHLDAINAGSPLHYWQKYINPERERREPTPDMILGSAIHSAVLEPDLFPLEFITPPKDAPRRPTRVQLEAKKPSGDTLLAIDWWKKFDKENADKTIISVEDHKRCLAIRDRIHTHPEVAYLFQGGQAEQSFYAIDDEEIIDPETGEVLDGGELIKCRFDYLHDSGDLAVDLKSTGDASQDGFGKSVANFRYMLQPPWYFDVLRKHYGECPRAWAFVAVEKDPPYAIGVYWAEPDQIERGRIAARRDFARIIKYRRANQWPDYAALAGNTCPPVKLPKWASV